MRVRESRDLIDHASVAQVGCRMQRRPTAHFLVLLHVDVWVEGQHLWRGTSGATRRSIAAAAVQLQVGQPGAGNRWQQQLGVRCGV